MALDHEGHAFWVIETCSGLRAVKLLTISAIVIRDLLGPESKRLWLLVVFAPFLALAFNVLRIVAIVALQSGQSTPEDHVFQGMIGVFAGTVLLFAVGHLMLASAPTEGASILGMKQSEAAAPRMERSLVGGKVWLRSTGVCAGLALLSLTVQPWPARTGDAPSLGVFEASRPGWEAERIRIARGTLGDLPLGEILATRFVRSSPETSDVEAVELRILVEAGGTVRRSLRASRLDSLGPEWRTEFIGVIHLWQIDREARMSLASRDDIRALSYRWEYADRSWLGTAVESALGLRRVPGWPFERPIDVRITTAVPGDGSPARRDRAKRVLDTFLTSFGPDLRKLGADRIDRR
jgi:exosortase/archaeosortase family protein